MTHDAASQRIESKLLSRPCFEGVRAQDILPPCIERFEIDVFVAYANVVDPFIDRSFGHAAEIDAGRIEPTRMIASMRVGKPGGRRFPRHLSPDCVRDPDPAHPRREPKA